MFLKFWLLLLSYNKIIKTKKKKKTSKEIVQLKRASSVFAARQKLLKKNNKLGESTCTRRIISLLFRCETRTNNGARDTANRFAKKTFLSVSFGLLSHSSKSPRFKSDARAYGFTYEISVHTTVSHVTFRSANNGYLFIFSVRHNRTIVDTCTYAIVRNLQLFSK